MINDQLLQDNIVNMYIKNRSLRSIGETLKVSHMTVKRVLELAGFELRQNKVNKDPFEPILTKVRCINLELSIFNHAYNNSEITLKELIREEDRLGRDYCRWISL